MSLRALVGTRDNTNNTIEFGQIIDMEMFLSPQVAAVAWERNVRAALHVGRSDEPTSVTPSRRGWMMEWPQHQIVRLKNQKQNTREEEIGFGTTALIAHLKRKKGTRHSWLHTNRQLIGMPSLFSFSFYFYKENIGQLKYKKKKKERVRQTTVTRADVYQAKKKNRSMKSFWKLDHGMLAR